MKTLFILSCLVLSALAQAKEMPSIELIQTRLDASGLTKVGQWSDSQDGIAQRIDGGTIVITNDGFAAAMELVETSDSELELSFLKANNVCVSGALDSIDMAQNTTLRQSMGKSFDSSLTAYENRVTTPAWGYQFKTELAKHNGGTLAICALR